jgi:hypothetical protein
MHPKCIETELSRLFRIDRLKDVNCPNKGRTVVQIHKTSHNVPRLIETPVPLKLAICATHFIVLLSGGYWEVLKSKGYK